MDANGTHFHLLLGYDDWAGCLELPQARSLRQAWEASPPQDSSLAWVKQRDELILHPRLFRFTAAPKDIPPALENRRGAARDRYGNWYWIADSRREILVNSAGTGTTSHFWTVGDGLACEQRARFGDFKPKEPKAPATPLLLSGLAVTTEHYLVVGVLDPAGLLIFDLHAGGAPQQVFWPPAVPFAPFDMAPRPCGGVWILDRDNKRYWALDRHLRVVNKDQAEVTLAPEVLDDFQPQDGLTIRRKPAETFPEGISLEAASPVAAVDPIAIEALPDDTVLILDHDPDPNMRFSIIHRYYFSQLVGNASTESVLGIVEDEVKADFRLRGYDFAFAAEHDNVPDRLYIVAAEGNQTFVFEISQQGAQLVLRPIEEYLPMRLFGGKGLVAPALRDGGIYYDFADRWIPLIVQGRPRYEIAAALLSPRFDGKEPNCVWHRLMLDACLPPETEVRVWSRAANDKLELENAAWLPEPRLHQRSDGSELPYVHQAENTEYGTWELLFQRARGRYLQIKLELTGNGRTTPRLRALRAYYPRFSYLERYLPAVYREDRDSAAFLDRYLANMEGFYTALEDKIAAVQMLFDVRSAPAETLEWLTSWFGVAADPVWDETKRRLFIKHAMDFFQYRGTIHGLRMALRLALEDCAGEDIFADPASTEQRRRPDAIRIVETYRTRQTPGVVLGDPTKLIGPRTLVVTARWLPNSGGEDLHRRYREALQLPATTRFPIRDPGGELSVAWQQFSRNTLGFVPSADSTHLKLWRKFLSRRYQTINALNTAYQLSGAQKKTAFTAIELPGTLPPDGAPLQDWYQFEGVVLAMHRTAHQFSVLLPAPRKETAAATAAEQQRRLDLAGRLVDLEKPAHTVFTVKFFWALFRVGAARLGEDTLIDLGSRAPQLMAPMVLGRNYLVESYLAPAHPQNVAKRQVLGQC
jgi:phage tail-like protein